MILALAVVLAFAVAAVNDWLSCRWQAARERSNMRAGIPIAALHEAIGWVPLLAAIELRTPLLAVASVGGAALGTWRGFVADRRARAACHASSVVLVPRFRHDEADAARTAVQHDRAPAPLPAPIKTPGGATVYPARIARTHDEKSPLRYRWGDEYRDADELKRIADQAPGLPVIVYHPDEDRPVAETSKIIVGHVLSARVDGDHVVVEFAVTHADGTAAIGRGVRELSLGYTSRLDDRGYQRDIKLDHLALVDRARCGPTCSLRADCADGVTPCGCAMQESCHTHNSNGARMDPEQVKKLIEEAVGPLKARADKADQDLAAASAERDAQRARADAAEQGRRTDAEATATAATVAVEAARRDWVERHGVEEFARRVLGPDAEKKARKFDGVDTIAIKCDVIKAVLKMDVAEGDRKSEPYVRALYDAAVKTFEDGAAGSAAVRSAVGSTEHARGDASEREQSASANLKTTLANAWRGDAAKED